MQASLFNLGTPQTVKTRTQLIIEKRERAEKAVYAHQSEAWREAVLDYAKKYFLPRRTGLFLAQTLRQSYDAYAKQHGKPLTAQSKAFAGIMSELRRQKLIVMEGSDRRENKVLAVTYKSLI